jgi:hypothetical protein
VFGGDRKNGVLWVFLEVRDAQIDWSIGFDARGVYSLITSAIGAQRQKQDPFFVFTETLQKVTAHPPTGVKSEPDVFS